MTIEDRMKNWMEAEEAEMARVLAGPPEGWDSYQPKHFPSGQPADAGHIRSVCLTDVRVEKPDWLWENRIARGSIVIVEGIEGVGKSTMLCALAGAVSRGQGLPDMYFNGPESVLWLAAEESLSITLKPRLMAAGADLDRVFAIDQPFSFDDAGMAVLMREVDERRPSMVIIDPIFAYTKGDPSKGSDARILTGQLKKIAEAYNCVIILVRHIGKSKGLGDPRAAGLYSIEWRAAARSVLLAGCDPDDERKCAVTQTKNNIGPKAEPIGYTIESDATSPSGARFSWTGLSDLTANRILAPRHMEDNEESAQRADAKEFLYELLKDGPVEACDVEKARRAANISDYSIRQAKFTLKVKTRKEGGYFNKLEKPRWLWEIDPVWPEGVECPGPEIKTADCLKNGIEGVEQIENQRLQANLDDKSSYHSDLPEGVEVENVQRLQQTDSTPSTPSVASFDWDAPINDVPEDLLKELNGLNHED